MPKQVFYFYDYLGPLVVALIFVIACLFIAFFILNFLLIRKEDDLTVFERVFYLYKIFY